ncbi:glomulin [Diprion similis]|uniref:glomulin n=1 Tax=Diprion similis TaxID=362088 RepID=UPI001EF80569|nr:glomulin [Diprion similis]
MSSDTANEPNLKNRSSRMIDGLTKSLSDENTEDILNLIKDEEFFSCLEDASSDLIPIISGYLTENNLRNKPQLFECCEKLLNIIAIHCNADEALLEFIEQAECPENDTKFCAILKPLGTTLQKITGSRGRSLEWCINTMKSHVSELPLPTNYNFEGDEVILAETDPAVFRLVNIYQELLTFLAPFIDEVSLKTSKNRNENQRQLLLSSLISLLGKPFCHLALEDEKSKQRTLAKEILKSISNLTGNLFRYFEYVEQRMLKGQVQSSKTPLDEPENDFSSGDGDLFAMDEIISDLAYANYYYLILSLELELGSVPCVYDPQYVLHNSLYLSSCMLKNPEYILIWKGLQLAKAALVRIEAFTVDNDVLELKIHESFVQNLSQVMIYCDAREKRDLALKVFNLYLNIFTIKAKYLLILHLYDLFSHSGLLSYLTTVVKDCVVKCLDSDPVDPTFTGKRMFALLAKACKMPFKTSVDLVEISDGIIASLNLIRFLVIRDKTNVTGIWNYTAKLESDFLKPLRTALHITRSHYELKIKDLEVQRKLDKSKEKNCGSKLDDEVSVTVGGETLPTIPSTEKIQFCRHALNAFDVVESILIRVNECIENRKIE